MKHIIFAIAMTASLSAAAQTAKNDYGDGKSWLCRPGRQDACAIDQTTTIVAADGKLTREAWQANPNAPIDCFYVYPTVSTDPGGNSDMIAGPEENGVVRAQLARFASQCKVYAPLYRQATLTALRAATTGSPIAVDRALGYNDVLDAWNHYLQHDNNGRGVVLIGHSQGSGLLTQLIRSEIDGKPVSSKFISALLLGTSLPVPKGKDVGGAFQRIPLCHSATHTGCVIAYASFRSTIAPPENSRFGRVQGENMQAACVNPAALGGGSGALHAYLSAGGRSIVGSAAEPPAWVTPAKPIDTPFVSVPGLLTAQCVEKGPFSYLEITVHGNPADPRVDDIAGDVMANGQVNASWGLHLIDVNLAMGNLVDIVREQGKAYLAMAGGRQVATTAAQSPAAPSDAEIRRILVDRIDAQKQSVGIVVGVIEPSGRRMVAYGKLAKDDPRPLNGDTVYEIGSITKVFTSLLLADAVGRGEVALTDPVAKFLPDKVKVPERGGRSITLIDLATHSSGLPRMPTNFTPKDPANPYADYSYENMYAFLSGYQLSRDIGSQYDYSNFGAGLLGHALVLRTRSTDYEALVRARILAPLGMTSTAVTFSPEMKTRLATGHGPTLQPVANWDLSALAGAGALRSTANDMLTFLAANLGYSTTPLAPAMAAMLKTRRPTTIPNMTIGLAWHVVNLHGKEIVWHNGGTAGYRTFIGFDPAAKIGVVVLSNAGTAAGPDDIGRHLLDAEMPLLGAPAAPKTRTETVVDPQTLDKYVGRYQLAPSVVITMTREGGRLYTQLTGQPKFEVFAESDKDFFLKVVDAQLTFETDVAGKAVAIVLHQNGQTPRATRIE